MDNLSTFKPDADQSAPPVGARIVCNTSMSTDRPELVAGIVDWSVSGGAWTWTADDGRRFHPRPFRRI